jgi:hypothetical protein
VGGGGREVDYETLRIEFQDVRVPTHDTTRRCKDSHSQQPTANSQRARSRSLSLQLACNTEAALYQRTVTR